MTFHASEVQVVTYCHCSDCKRVTGSPLPAFAAVALDDVKVTPFPGEGRDCGNGIRRWNCETCGSPLAATYPYLPGQAYIPLGLIDQAADLAPSLHCHADNALPWLHQSDNVPRQTGTGRAILQAPPDSKPS